MTPFKWVAAGLGALVLVIALGIAGWQFDWWLAEKNIDRQVQIDNRQKGTQTAWRDEAYDDITRIETLPEGSPARLALTRQVCSLIDRLTGPYQDETLIEFKETRCI